MTADGAATVAAVVLAATFGIAAVAKLRDPAGSARSLADLGVPRPWAAARLVPVAEIVVALAVLVVPLAGSVAAAIVLAAFSVFLLDRLRSGVRTPCACFGGGRRHPLSAADPLRNLLLLALALMAGSADRLVVPSPVEVAAGVVAVAAGVGLVAAARRLAAPNA